jgi:hypothetical protein
MASKRKPQNHRAGRPGARRTRSTRKSSVAQSGRTNKAHSIPLSRLGRRLVYRDRVTGRFVSKSTWNRSRAHGGSRYIRVRRYSANLNVLGDDGFVPASVHSSKQAHLASEHLIAVNRFLRTGDSELLKPFVGKSVGGVELLIDPNRFHELAEAGLVKLDNLYRQNRGVRQEK